MYRYTGHPKLKETKRPFVVVCKLIGVRFLSLDLAPMCKVRKFVHKQNLNYGLKYCRPNNFFNFILKNPIENIIGRII